MAEYIEREVLTKNFCGYDQTKCVKYGNENAEQQHDSYSTMMMYEIADEIEDAPASDVAPVRHGRWLLDGRCSECLANPLTTHKNYCPNCGAMMEGGSDG